MKAAASYMDIANLVAYAILAGIAIAIIATVGWPGFLFVAVVAFFLPPNGRRGI